MYVAHYNSQKIQFTPERTKICIVLRSLVLLSSTSQSHTQAHAHQLEGTTNQLLKAVNLFTLCMCNQGHVVCSFTFYMIHNIMGIEAQRIEATDLFSEEAKKKINSILRVAN